MQVLVDRSFVTISNDMYLQMHDLIQAMAQALVREESIRFGKPRRLFISYNFYNISGQNKVELTERVEVLVVSLEKFIQKVHIDANDFAHMKKLRILKIYQEQEKVYEEKLELKGHDVIFSGNLNYLSNELSLFYWHGYPFKYLPSDFYPQNIVAIDMSYSNIKQLWTTPKSFRRLKVVKLRHCCNLTTTADFSEITNLKELSLEGCVNLFSVHPSIGMLKRLIVLNLRDCKRLQNFPSIVEMDTLQVLNLTGCLKVDQLPNALGRMKSLTELHIDGTGITELPSFISSLINLESLSFGGHGRIQPRWWTSIIARFGLLSKQQHPPRSLSLAALHMLKQLNISYCNLEQVPESIGGLSHLNYLNLQGNNFSRLPGSLSQLFSLYWLHVNGCKKLEVLPELPPNMYDMDASDCTSLREVLGSFMSRNNYFSNCPKLLFKNVSIDSDGSISKKSECVDSSITSQSSNIHQLSAFFRYLGLQTNNRCEFFSQDNAHSNLDIIYHGNIIPEWFRNRSLGGNHVKVELPSEDSSKEDWCYGKLKGFGTCVVFKCKKPFNIFQKWYSVKNFDGASLTMEDYIPYDIWEYLKKEEIGIQEESYIIWLHYTKYIWGLEKAKKFVRFSFLEEVINEDVVEVKESGVRLIYDEDLEQDVTMLSMFHDLPTPTQNGGAMHFSKLDRQSSWSW